MTKENDLKIGDTIRDMEDNDCYYEGVVVSLNPLKYKIQRTVWDGEEGPDEMIGRITEQMWWYIEKINLEPQPE